MYQHAHVAAVIFVMQRLLAHWGAGFDVDAHVSLRGLEDSQHGASGEEGAVVPELQLLVRGGDWEVEMVVREVR